MGQGLKRNNNMKVKFLNAAIAALIMAVSGAANAGLINQWDIDFVDLNNNNKFTTVRNQNQSGSKLDADAPRLGTKLWLNHNSWFSLDLFDAIGVSSLSLNEQYSDIILSFDFNVNGAAPEIAGIQVSIKARPSRRNGFNLGGRHSWGIKDIEYDSDGSAWQRFNINLDQYLTGSFSKLIFINDCDARKHCGEGKEATVLYRNMQISQVPEPSTLAIFALGLLGLTLRRMKKQS